MIPDNACALRITAAAGTELAGASSGGTVKPGDDPGISSPLTGVYTPKGFIPHAVSLGQAFAHCPIFPAAASRRSLGRISVPVWPDTLSGRLPVVGLVGRYPTNYLIGRGPIPRRQRGFRHTPPFTSPPCDREATCGISPPLGGLSPTWG